LLFQKDQRYDFTGRLSFSWPSNAIASKSNKPLFELGYGLYYGSKVTVDKLSEISGLENSQVASTGVFYSKGAPVAPWGLWLNSGELVKQVASFPTSVGGLIVSKTDHKTQEDAIRIQWTRSDLDQIRLSATAPSNMSGELKDGMELTFSAKSFGGKTATVQIGMCTPGSSCNHTLDVNIASENWQEYSIPLSCFANLGVDMSKVSTALMITAGQNVDIGLSDIRLASGAVQKSQCK